MGTSHKSPIRDKLDKIYTSERLPRLRILQNIQYVAIFIAFVFAPMWLKWSFAPPAFTGRYVLGFVIVLPVALAILCWALCKFDGWQRIVQSKWHVLWFSCLIALNIWGFFSQFWAYGIERYPGMAQTTILQLFLVSVFSLVIIATPKAQRFIITALIFSMVVHGAIGQVQVIVQGDLGLAWLGEFTLNPDQSGISVLEANGTRWLRPHGLLPHPNVLAGIIVLGLFAACAWILDSGKEQIIGTIAFLIGFWFLLLTFSRGAWLGFGVGILFALPFVMRRKHFYRKIIPVVIGVVIVGSLFIMTYQDFLLSRVGVGEQNTELRSIADRLVYNQIAWDAIQTYPVQGVGIGNYPWYAANYLFYRTDYDLRGANVHNIYLGVFADLGGIGFSLFLLMLIAGVIGAMQQRSLSSVALTAGFIAWGVVGLVDHYMWTLILTQALWMGILASGLSGAAEPPPVAD